MSVEIHSIAAYLPPIKKFRVEYKAKGHNYVRLFTAEEFLRAVRTQQFPWGIKISGDRRSEEAERMWEYLGSVAALYEHNVAIFEKLPMRFTRRDFLKAYVEAYVDA